MKNDILEMALRYAEIGISVMPLHGIKEDSPCTCRMVVNAAVKVSIPSLMAATSLQPLIKSKY